MSAYGIDGRVFAVTRMGRHFAGLVRAIGRGAQRHSTVSATKKRVCMKKERFFFLCQTLYRAKLWVIGGGGNDLDFFVKLFIRIFPRKTNTFEAVRRTRVGILACGDPARESPGTIWKWRLQKLRNASSKHSRNLRLMIAQITVLAYPQILFSTGLWRIHHCKEIVFSQKIREKLTCSLEFHRSSSICRPLWEGRCPWILHRWGDPCRHGRAHSRPSAWTDRSRPTRTCSL